MASNSSLKMSRLLQGIDEHNRKKLSDTVNNEL
jgi:hypothetical protein